MHEKLLRVQQEYDRLSAAMMSPEVAADPGQYQKYARAQAEIADTVVAFRTYTQKAQDLEGVHELLHGEADPELRAMAEEERERLEEDIETLEQELRVLLLPKDPLDGKNTILEIRAGTGGEEAALFAADLYRMYQRYAELTGWRTEVMNAHPTGLKGMKEISFRISGNNVYSQLKFEGGVHRVQRVPETEAQGRIHTSAVTVAVLPEADEVDVKIDPNDLEFDVYRSSGPGGQSVNTTDSAVRVTHKPTGLVVTCQDEKSQHKNKAKALQVLRSRLLAQRQEEEQAARSANRRSQVGSGDRSERIRTYNFPQNRLTDHRISLTLYNLDRVMEGELQEVIDALISADRAERLAAV